MLALFMQGVECMEEFLLRRFFAGQELNIVNEQDVHVAVLVAEAFPAVVTDRVDEFIREFL
ncbi:hypothetical protein D3C76_1566220 [compost metagenome]